MLSLRKVFCAWLLTCGWQGKHLTTPSRLHVSMCECVTGHYGKKVTPSRCSWTYEGEHLNNGCSLVAEKVWHCNWSVNTTSAHTSHTLVPMRRGDTLLPFFFFFSPVGSVSAPKLALRLPVFLCVSVKCIHRLLRGLRLEGDCFRSDKNRLAPKRGAGIVGAGCLRNRHAHCSAALERRQCVHADEKDRHWGVCRNTQALNHTVIDSYFYSQKVKSKHLGFFWINACTN